MAVHPHGHPAAVRHVGVFDYTRNYTHNRYEVIRVEQREITTKPYMKRKQRERYRYKNKRNKTKYAKLKTSEG
jgi:hypothetical protein